MNFYTLACVLSGEFCTTKKNASFFVFHGPSSLLCPICRIPRIFQFYSFLFNSYTNFSSASNFCSLIIWIADCQCISKKVRTCLPPHQLCSWSSDVLHFCASLCTFTAVCCRFCFQLTVSTTSLVLHDFPVSFAFLKPSITSSLITFDPWLILPFSSELAEWNWNKRGRGSFERSELSPGVQPCLELGPGRWSWSYYTT